MRPLREALFWPKRGRIRFPAPRCAVTPHNGLGLGNPSKALLNEGMQGPRCDISAKIPVPHPIVLYALLSLLDYAFTLAAFVMGAVEANPALAWFQMNGLFDFAKLSSTLLVCCIAFRLWKHRLVRRIITLANAMMLGLIFYHCYLWLRMGFSPK